MDFIVGLPWTSQEQGRNPCRCRPLHKNGPLSKPLPRSLARLFLENFFVIRRVIRSHAYELDLPPMRYAGQTRDIPCTNGWSRPSSHQRRTVLKMHILILSCPRFVNVLNVILKEGSRALRNCAYLSTMGSPSDMLHPGSCIILNNFALIHEHSLGLDRDDFLYVLEIPTKRGRRGARNGSEGRRSGNHKQSRTYTGAQGRKENAQ
ncbi:hypothetical protein V1515DRAFT_420530 [Lipomyces mesembrius]